MQAPRPYHRPMPPSPYPLPPQRYEPGELVPRLTMIRLDLRAVPADRRDDPLITDPAYYAPVKRFGIFAVDMVGHGHTRKKMDIYPPVNPRNSYIQLMLPGDSAEQISRTSVTDSFSLLARFIELHSLTPDRIQGTTYERLGKLARHFGFEVAPAPRPKRLLHRADQMFMAYLGRSLARQAGIRGDLGPTVVVTQQLAPFLERYGALNKDSP